ncbi:MAG: DUF1634 domain-containing protein [Desulfobacteraceae bacterium]|nr:DUF1634 domain-containing protein [Desulfobacteraceae bacterium]
MSGKIWSDKEISVIIGYLLRTGVLIAAATVFAGGIVYLTHFGDIAPNYKFFRGEPADLRSVGEVVRDTITFNGKSLIQLGLLLLIATPVARVAFSILAFAVQRDRLYILVTVFVLAVLVFSLAGGI